MAGGWWSTAKAHELAGRWGLSLSAIKWSSAEASRQLKMSRGDLDEQRETNLGRLEAAYTLAMGSGDALAAVTAVKAIAQVDGTLAPKKSAETDASGKDLPRTPPLPPQLQALAQDPRFIRLWALLGARPTPAQLEQLQAGTAPETIAALLPPKG
jgi:hypothetical protein